MSEKPHIIVGGLARCGTTLMMHMLHAGGVSCIGAKPAFEVDEINHRAVNLDFLARHPGHAFKLLDPHMTALPDGLDAVVIWLDRDVDEQARSQAKFVQMLAGAPRPNRAQMRRWAAGLRADRPAALACLSRWPGLVMRFEDLIEAPQVSALQVAVFLAPYWRLNAGAMAAQVRPRPSTCAPDMAIELSLSAEACRGAA